MVPRDNIKICYGRNSLMPSSLKTPQVIVFFSEHIHEAHGRSAYLPNYTGHDTFSTWAKVRDRYLATLITTNLV